MISKATIDGKASATVTRKRGLVNELAPKGKFHVEHWRAGKLIGIYEMPNGVTNEGKNHMLGVTFNAATPVTTWYIGLVDNAGFSAFAAADVMSSHAGWTEYQLYSEANRVTWVENAPASQSITNTTLAEFTITGTTDEVKGVFVVSNNTKGGTTGTLWATAAFATVIPVDASDVLKVTYTVSLT